MASSILRTARKVSSREPATASPAPIAAATRSAAARSAAEDPRDRLRAIVAERLADDLPERPERDAVAVREALTLEHTRCVGDRVGELARELRLPDARGGENREQLRRALADAALEVGVQCVELPLAPDELRVEAAQDRRRAGDDLDEPPRRSLRLQPGGAADEPLRAGADEGLRRTRHEREPRSRGDDLPVDGETALVRLPDDRRAGVDADLQARPRAVGAGAKLGGGPQGAERIVLVHRRHAEHAHDRAGVQRLHEGAVALEDGLGRRLRLADDGPARLGVDDVRRRREEDRDHDDLASRLRQLPPRWPQGCGALRLHRGIVPEDRLLERAECGRRLEAELVGEQLPRLLVRGERLGLPTRAVEGEHQLRPRPLPQRLLPHEGLEVTDEVRVATQLQFRFDTVLKRRYAQLLEARDRSVGKLRVGEVGERTAVPELERLAEPRDGLRGLARRERFPAGGGQLLELLRVDALRPDDELVAAWPGDERPLRQLAAERRDRVPDHPGSRRRRRRAPEIVDQGLDRHGLVRAQEQGSDERLPGPTKLDEGSAPQHLERAEYAEACLVTHQ